MEIEMMINKYRLAGPLAASAKAKRVYLEEFKRTLLALLMKDAEIKGCKVVSAQDRDAYADDRYVDHLKGYKVAVEEDELMKFEVKRLELEIEVWRTQQANERLERKAYSA